MREGSYKKKIKSSRWLRMLETNHFKPRSFKDGDYHGSCGTTALATITGIDPKKISKKLPKHIDSWSDKRMIDFLNKNKFGAIEITKATVTQNPHWIEEPINENHVLLISQLAVQNEGTWAVAYKGKWYHNFESESLNLFSFLNNPLMSVYVITKEEWVKKKIKEIKKSGRYAKQTRSL